MTLGQVIQHLEGVRQRHGDLPFVLYDLDTGNYYEVRAEHFELQRMPCGTVRVSFGLNDWNSSPLGNPAERPL